MAAFVGLAITGNYRLRSKLPDLGRAFTGCVLGAAIPAWAALRLHGWSPAFPAYTLGTGLVWLGLAAERLGIDYALNRPHLGRGTSVDALLVGLADDCREAALRPELKPLSAYRPVGFLDVQDPPGSGALGHVAEIEPLLAASGVRAVVVCGRLEDTDLNEVVSAALVAGCQVLCVPGAMRAAVGVHPNTSISEPQPLVRLTAPSLRGWQRAVKRSVDVIGAAIGLVITGPLMGLIAAAIRLESPGPAIFEQERVGTGGQPFRILKFRTMTDGADSLKGSVAHLNHSGDPRLFKIPDDPRVTGLGRWLRRWSLDELPQLWNVLRGDMSLVGPRPFFRSDFKHYRLHHFYRLGAKPGLTGLWQVSGRSLIVDFEDVVAIDTSYVREWSLLLDFKILLRTPSAALRGRGAV